MPKLYRDLNYDTDRVVDESDLDSVDELLEFQSASAFPEEGEAGKMYVDKSENRTYRWTGTAYVEVGAGVLRSRDGRTAVEAGNDGAVHVTTKGAGLGDDSDLSGLSDFLGLQDSSTLGAVEDALGLQDSSTLGEAAGGSLDDTLATVAYVDDHASSYTFATPEIEYSSSSSSGDDDTAGVSLVDHAVNRVSLGVGVNYLNVTFPERREGKVRDLFLKLTITSQDFMTVSFSEADGTAVKFDLLDPSWADVGPGTSLFMFTDTER